MPTPTISVSEASAAVTNGRGTLIDVRTPAEFREVHAAGARLVSLDILSRQEIEAARGSTPGPVYLICASGIRATKAAAELQIAGVLDAQVVEGGTTAWVSAGLPVVRGKKTISIERQVRIGAGSLVLTGTLLGWLVNPLFYLLAGFVGAGLVFAGVTDICGMAIVLAKAPWNRTRQEAPSPAKPASSGT